MKKSAELNEGGKAKIGPKKRFLDGGKRVTTRRRSQRTQDTINAKRVLKKRSLRVMENG